MLNFRVKPPDPFWINSDGLLYFLDTYILLGHLPVFCWFYLYLPAVLGLESIRSGGCPWPATTEGAFGGFLRGGTIWSGAFQWLFECWNVFEADLNVWMFWNVFRNVFWNVFDMCSGNEMLLLECLNNSQVTTSGFQHRIVSPTFIGQCYRQTLAKNTW